MKKLFRHIAKQELTRDLEPEVRAVAMPVHAPARMFALFQKLSHKFLPSNIASRLLLL